jgi:hypothetical protein
MMKSGERVTKSNLFRAVVYNLWGQHNSNELLVPRKRRGLATQSLQKNRTKFIKHDGDDFSELIRQVQADMNALSENVQHNARDESNLSSPLWRIMMFEILQKNEHARQNQLEDSRLAEDHVQQTGVDLESSECKSNKCLKEEGITTRRKKKT